MIKVSGNTVEFKGTQEELLYELFIAIIGIEDDLEISKRDIINILTESFNAVDLLKENIGFKVEAKGHNAGRR